MLTQLPSQPNPTQGPYRPEQFVRAPVSMGTPQTQRPDLLRMARSNVYQALAQQAMRY